MCIITYVCQVYIHEPQTPSQSRPVASGEWYVYYVCIDVYMYKCMYTCVYVYMYVCIYVCLYVCMFVHMYACIYVCLYMCICVYVYV